MTDTSLSSIPGPTTDESMRMYLVQGDRCTRLDPLDDNGDLGQLPGSILVILKGKRCRMIVNNPGDSTFKWRSQVDTVRRTLLDMNLEIYPYTKGSVIKAIQDFKLNIGKRKAALIDPPPELNLPSKLDATKGLLYFKPLNKTSTILEKFVRSRRKLAVRITPHMKAKTFEVEKMQWPTSKTLEDHLTKSSEKLRLFLLKGSATTTLMYFVSREFKGAREADCMDFQLLLPALLRSIQTVPAGGIRIDRVVTWRYRWDSDSVRQVSMSLHELQEEEARSVWGDITLLGWPEEHLHDMAKEEEILAEVASQVCRPVSRPQFDQKIIFE